MTLRLAKQIIYGALYLVIIVGIVAGFYFLFLRGGTASCFDNKQDGGETGVDCGGPCAAVCIPSTLQNISVVRGSVLVFNPYPELSSLPVHYTLLAQVANVNAEFGTKAMDYQFNLYSAPNALVQSVPGRSFIYGGEVKYLIVPNLSVSEPVDYATLTVQSSTTWTPSSTMGGVPQFGNPLPIVGSALTSSTITVNGRLTDGDASSFTNVLIVAVFYDASGNAVGASQTVVDRIAQGETADFSVMYPATPGIVPGLTKAYAYASR